jgi:hypothetical protein
MDDNDSQLDYVSSVDPFTPEKDDPSVDAPDEKALERVMVVLDAQIRLYHTITGVKQFSDKLTVEQRFELCDQYTKLLGNLVLLINNAIEGIKEKQK